MKKQDKVKKQKKSTVNQSTVMVNYPVGDFLVRVKNASLADRKEVVTSFSNKILAVATALKKLGVLNEVEKKEGVLSASLAYKKKEPVLLDLKLVSRPGLRIYMGVDEIESVRGPFIFLLSTPKGILSGKEAIKLGVGGEVIAKIW